jgi:hypothetical protein
MTVLAILLALSAPATRLSVEPWTGSDFQATSEEAAKYRLEVSGKPNAAVHLRALGVARGWLAAFCTPHLCSPQRIDVQLPRSGDAVFQFELIRESGDAPRQSGATITDNDGASVTVPAAFRQ